MKKINIITLTSIFLLLILSAGIAFASENATDGMICQDNHEDIVSANVSGDKFSDIQTSIDEAHQSDVIELNGTYTGDGQIKISKSLTIQSTGNAATLDGQNDTRIIYIEKGDVTFKNIIFINGVSNKGGAVYSLGNCIFENCTFVNNFAQNGGAIYSQAGLTIIGCNFENNGVKSSGGAICCEYSLNKNASKSRYGNISIVNSDFKNNCAGNGGAFYVYLSGNLRQQRDYAIVSVKNSRFDRNTADEFGGAIHFDGSEYYGKLNIDKSNFTQNSANEGSAIEVSDCKMALTDSLFSKNTGYYGAVYVSFSSVATINGCSFQSNSADAVSAVMLYSAEATLVDCKFSANSVATVNSYSDSKLIVKNGKSTTTYKKRAVLDNSLKSVTTLTVLANDLAGVYNSHDKFTIQLIDKNTKKPIKYFAVDILFNNGKKTKTFRRTTNADGKVTLKLTTSLNVGKYKVTYVSDDWGNIDSVKHAVTVKKAKATVKAPEITSKHKKSAYFKVKVYDNYNKEGAYNVKVKVKVYTGKNAKTYHLKTNYNGVAKLNVKKLSKGSHKVVITSEDANYKFSAKSKIKIK